jgi:hypothetical protein
MKTNFGLLGCGCIVLMMLAVHTCAAYADPPAPATKPKAASSLDDELFKGLDDATDVPGVTAKTTAPAPTRKSGTAASDETKKSDPTGPSSKPAAQPKVTNPLDAELLRQLEGDGESPPKPKKSPQSGGGQGGKSSSGGTSDDPFQRITEQIRDAEQRLARSDSGNDTQELQRRIVDDLEKLIDQIEQQQQQQQQSSSQSQQTANAQRKPGAGQPKPASQQPQNERDSQQAKDSDDKIRKGQVRKPDPGRIKSLLEKVWGSLPERERQNVMQSSVDDFPAKYQGVIEEYFKTLLKRQD